MLCNKIVIISFSTPPKPDDLLITRSRDSPTHRGKGIFMSLCGIMRVKTMDQNKKKCVKERIEVTSKLAGGESRENV